MTEFEELIKTLKQLRDAGVDLVIRLTPKQMRELNTKGVASDRILGDTVMLVTDAQPKEEPKIKVKDNKFLKDNNDKELPINGHLPTLTKAQTFLCELHGLKDPVELPNNPPARHYKSRDCQVCGKCFSPHGARDTVCYECRCEYGRNLLKAIDLINDFKSKNEKDLPVEDVFKLPNSMRWHFAKHWTPEQQKLAKKLGREEMDMHKTIDRLAKESRPLDYKE